jgi:hypothetical protein
VAPFSLTGKQLASKLIERPLSGSGSRFQLPL